MGSVTGFALTLDELSLPEIIGIFSGVDLYAFQ